MAEQYVLPPEKVMNIMEAAIAPAAFPATAILVFRDLLAILVSTGKCKEAIGVNLTHEQVRRLDEKEVMKHYKRYETNVGTKTVETLIVTFLALYAKTGFFVLGYEAPARRHSNF